MGHSCQGKARPVHRLVGGGAMYTGSGIKVHQYCQLCFEGDFPKSLVTKGKRSSFSSCPQSVSTSNIGNVISVLYILPNVLQENFRGKKMKEMNA